MNKNAKIYVAGHTGLVGSAIVRRLEEEKYANLITRSHAELDLMRQFDVETFFQKEKPEYVFLAAAKVGGILANNTYPAEFIYNNLAITINVIHAAWETGVKRMLFLGSSCIYPRECPQPMKEEYLLTGPLEPTNEPYAVAKIAGIKMCQSYNRQYGTRFFSVMPTNLYGPNDNFGLETSHVLPALIRKFHLAKLAAQGDWELIERDKNQYGPIPDDFRACLISISRQKGHTILRSASNSSLPAPAVTLWGSGSPFRELLHVDDLADAGVFIMSLEEKRFISLLRAYRTPLINIGFGKDISIKELSRLVKDIVGFDGECVFDTGRPDGMPKKLLDASRITALGWNPKISLKDGVRQTYEWYLKENISS